MNTTEQKRLRRSALAIATSLFCAGLAPVAWAEANADAAAAADTTAAPEAATAPDAAGSAEDAPEQPRTLANIIVTAQKREQAAIDVPASVTSVDAKQLSRNGQTRIQDYSAEIPGLSSTSGRPGQNQVVIRGISTGTAQGAATTGIYLDEAPVGSVNAYTVGSQLVPDIDPSELSRIEVLKGPQGTLYGAGAMGGLMRYVTANPKYDDFSGSVTLGGSSVSHGDNGGLGRFYVNAPVGDSTALQIGGFYRDEPGFIDTVNGKEDVNSYSSKGGRFAFNWLINDDWKVQASAFTHRIDADGTQTVDVDAQTLKPLYDEYVQNARVDQPSETELDLYNLTVKGRLGIFDVVSSTTYQTFDSSATADASDLYGVLLGAIFQIPNFGTYLTQQTSTERWSQEVRFDASALDGRLTYQFGGYYTDEDDFNRIPSIEPFNTVTGAPIPLPFYLAKARIDSTYEEWSGFANATYAFTPKFSVQAGVRYSDDHQTYAQDYSGALIGPVPLVQEGTEDGTQSTWLLSASYKPSDDSLIYGRAATGYRPGGPNAVPPPNIFPAPTTFEPDELTSYEIGYKGVFADGRVSFEGALFTTDWEDIQIQTSAGGFNFFVNGGEATSRGAEATLLWYPIDALSLRATYSYIDAELTEDAPLAGGKDGDQLPFVPEHTASLGALYQWQAFGDWNASFGGSVNFIGERQSNYSQKARVDVPDYTTVNLNASIEKAHWRFTLYGRNLNDSDGITALGQKGLLPGMNPYAAGVITPRTFGVEASYRF